MSSRRKCKRAKERYRAHLQEIADFFEPHVDEVNLDWEWDEPEPEITCFAGDYYDEYDEHEVFDYYGDACMWDYDHHWDDHYYDDGYDDFANMPEVGSYFKDASGATYLCCRVHHCTVFVDVHTGKEAKPDMFALERVG